MQPQVQERTEERWHMGRVGILNFWYYDEEIFELEEGRIILRGANGSGKSVTMQSFLPLVLDGDKRPHRLDPFGSRDRRIEYYLLGEADSGKTDVTGYLWMEFVKPKKGLTKTIGIGLRARRGANQVQFWGFLIDDGRRIGKDFWLYDRHHWLEQQTRVPLSRQELEKAIGTGGQVVHDQASYRDLVNKHLFGFADAEAFNDLLHLMIQLRSPKLSKDFKPSAIYDILHSALPPLAEDDLRPLSEVLEDMDQIADRLDELRLHKKEMEKLAEAYGRYNKRTLYDLSLALLEQNAAYASHRKIAADIEARWAQAEEAKRAAQAEIARAEEDLQRIAAELDVLEKHEAIGKQRELESVQEQLKDAERSLALAEERIGKNRRKLDQIRREAEERQREKSRLASTQREFLDELEGIAQEIEFAEHAVYRRNWDREEPEDDSWRAPWKPDLRQHRERLERAYEMARKEQEAARSVKQAEEELGEARKVRDERERERNEASAQLEAAKDAFREAAVRWRGNLRELAFSEEQLRAVFAAVTAYGPDSRSLDAIRAPLRDAQQSGLRLLAEQLAELKQTKRELADKREQLKAEKAAWETSREPEPARTEARERRRRMAGTGQGAPLYAVCDFHPSVSETEKAAIEEALERSGLLDAWIAPDGRAGIAAMEAAGGSGAAGVPNVLGESAGAAGTAGALEEVWIVPNPQLMGYTLADVLVPSPSAESGLSAEIIDQVLRTIWWSDESAIDGTEPAGAALTGTGAFQLGPLVGKTACKERAQYIGRETRRRTRMLEIARLAKQLESVEAEIRETEAQMAEIAERERALQAEAAAFPSCAGLEQSLHALQDASSRLEAALNHLERVQERYRSKTAEWRDLQRQVAELTSDWTRLKREAELKQAIDAARDYEAVVSELHSAWSRSLDAVKRIAALAEEEQSLTISVEDDELLTDELHDKRRSLRAQGEALRKLMDDLGVADISRRIAALKGERSRRIQEQKHHSETFVATSEQAAAANANLQASKEREAELADRLERAAAKWRKEIGRHLTPEWRERYRPEADLQEACALANEIRRSYDGLFAGRNADTVKNRLLEVLNEVRSLLTDYVLESEIEDDTGRIIVLSKRDRLHPQPPNVVLEELERDELEQSALLSEKDRELYEEVILRSVGKAIRQRIHRAESWVRRMNKLMEERNTSSGLRLKLDWEPKASRSEQEMDTLTLVELLKRDSHRLRDDEIDAMIGHFRYQIGYAKQAAQSEQESLRKHLYEVLDYRNWFQFELKYRKGEQTGYRPLTDARFNVLSGGEKAMAMYIPLFAAAWSRYSDARADAPRLISLDEAFAGVDEENMRDMFQLLTEMGFDYMMTSQVLWGCYDTVPKLAIYEIYRPKDVDFVTLFRYRWNGRIREYVDPSSPSGSNSVSGSA